MKNSKTPKPNLDPPKDFASLLSSKLNTALYEKEQESAKIVLKVGQHALTKALTSSGLGNIAKSSFLKKVEETDSLA